MGNEGPTVDLGDQEATRPEQPTLPRITDEDEETLAAPLSESMRAEIERAKTKAKEPAAGAGKLFSRDPTAVRHVLPTDEESDALLDSLFDDDDAPRAMPAAAP